MAPQTHVHITIRNTILPRSPQFAYLSMLIRRKAVMGPDDFTPSPKRIAEETNKPSFQPFSLSTAISFLPLAPIGTMELTWYRRAAFFHAHRNTKNQVQGNNIDKAPDPSMSSLIIHHSSFISSSYNMNFLVLPFRKLLYQHDPLPLLLPCQACPHLILS